MPIKECRQAKAIVGDLPWDNFIAIYLLSTMILSALFISNWTPQESKGNFIFRRGRLISFHTIFNQTLGAYHSHHNYRNQQAGFDPAPLVLWAFSHTTQADKKCVDCIISSILSSWGHDSRISIVLGKVRTTYPLRLMPNPHSSERIPKRMIPMSTHKKSWRQNKTEGQGGGSGEMPVYFYTFWSTLPATKKKYSTHTSLAFFATDFVLP